MLKANEFELKLAATQLRTCSFKFINTKIYALSVSNAHSIFARISYINFFVSNVLAQVVKQIELKGYVGSILRPQKSKSIIAPPISITVHHKARKRLCNPANWSRACPTKLSRNA
ncbi:hypothetical protein DW901_14575 [Firmicutes bacterium AM41-5BH]|nr:hypothetical protein DW901_14575 [Firmicutes bacterium AM41-5BH]